MSQIDVSKQEARLIAVRRAIEGLNDTFGAVIGVGEASAAEDALSQIMDFDAIESEYTTKEMKAFLKGYISGLAIAEITSSPQTEELIYQEPYEGGTFVGEGPSGGVALEQGEDPNFVTQSGVH